MMCLIDPPGNVREGARWSRAAACWTVLFVVLLAIDRLPGAMAAESPAEQRVLTECTLDMRQSVEQARYQPLSHRDDIWYGSTYWTGPDWTRVGRDWHHPGEQTSAVRRFVVPRDGRIQILGRVAKADPHGGDGVHVEIRVGPQVAWEADIEAADTVGQELALAIDVRQGDAIRFVVHRRGTIGFDTTHWDPAIVYEDGERFVASQGFSTGPQGAQGWHYEMEPDSDRGSVSPWPVVHGFRPQMLLYERTCEPPQGVAVRAEEALPAWIVTRGADEGGFVLCAATAAPCLLQAAWVESGVLRVQVLSAAAPTEREPQPAAGEPVCVQVPYEGTWLHGVRALHQLLARDTEHPELKPLRDVFIQAAERAGIAQRAEGLPELELCALVQLDWARQDHHQDEAAWYARTCALQLDRTRNLRAALPRQRAADALRLEHLHQQFKELDTTPATDRTLDRWRWLYQQTRWLKRHIALANPLLDFGPLLFCKRVPTSYSHLVMQYYGWRARPGGGIFVLDRPGYSLACRDIFAGKLAHGNVLEPRLSYDGQRVVFSFVACRDDGHVWEPAQLNNQVDEGFYHVWTGGVDGTDLRQLTTGPYDDLMPCWLPDGGFAFSSTRRRGYARCFGGQFSPRWHVYTVHRMQGDGTDIRLLSAHDTNEWFPVVSHAGHILYSRWDYIDRDAVTHQNLWAMRPDGTNPIAVWGNATSSPHCAFQAQPVPNSGKIVFTASAHHSITGGSLVLLEPGVGVDGHAAITRLTPEIPFPEAESMDIREYYAAPWPLSEDYFLAAYSPFPLVWEPNANPRHALGLYLLDRWGNRELLYRDPDIGATNPCPLQARPVPPVIPQMLADTETDVGEMVLLDVYQGLGDIPRGSIKQLRVIQIFPKTTPVADSPRVGLAREENARAILGTVPVEADGSARFLVPALKPVLFQALDEDGYAYQTMRTITYVQPGERVACIGCHESRATTPGTGSALALLRDPSRIESGPLDGRPFSYVEMVQPVLDQHCVRCHNAVQSDGQLDLSAAPHDGFTRSYWSLCGDRDFWGPGTSAENAAAAWVPRFGARNQIQVTPPGGQFGARGSRLLKLLRAGHYDVALTAEDFRRLAAWIDCNAIFYGVYDPDEQARQLRGEVFDMPDVQ
ncbi:MAG: hypothetical protein MUF48_06910 [Pirellulaceae bacterium]|nr:hypothetical protein [Pirellulaceae bacterium]